MKKSSALIALALTLLALFGGGFKPAKAGKSAPVADQVSAANVDYGFFDGH